MYILPLHCATVIPDDEAEAVDGTEPASEVESDVGDHDPPLIPLTDAGLGLALLFLLLAPRHPS